MADSVFLPGNILSLAAGAADRLIAAGNGDAALLYLWLLKAGGAYQTGPAAHALRWDPARTEAALSLLVGMGLAEANTQALAPALHPSEEPPEYTAADLNRELENKDSPFPALVGEVQRRLGKVLSTADLKCLYTIYDFAGLPAEVILLAVSWCVEESERKYGPGRKPRLPQIQKEALRWKERGVDTMEGAEAHLKRLAMLRSRSGQIMALLDIRDRPPVAREKEYIAAWVDMGFDDEAIRLAYEKTVLKKQSLNWPYMNSILKNWHQKGLHTLAQITAGDSVRPQRPASAAGATAPQPAAPGEADRRAREDMERMRAFLRQHSEEGT
ncbi:DnaD domain protein [Pseudoflavonifractor phocaeensis]|uniref:DnaD domain protein n=1 Tax=Pseudoflavonifractor phocaeensis TaxID=1870988 RepID=UPI00313AC459